MLLGALIGVIVAIIVITIKKSNEKKAMKNLLDNDLVDTPEYAAFFHYATETTQNRKGIKFFDSNGPLFINNNTIHYTNKLNKETLEFNLANCNVSLAPEKRKMKWIEIEKDGVKHYFTSFSQGAFTMDKKEMDKFISKLREIKVL